MPERQKRTTILCAVVFALICGALPVRVSAQAGGGSIVGRVRIAPGNEIKSPVLVNLGTRGTTVNSVYTDNEGNFGFTGLPGNLYHIEINETGYLPVQEEVVIDPVTTTMRIVDIYLNPRDAKTKSSDPIKGGNTRLADSGQYAHEIQIPKLARKEFEKGVKLDRNGKSDEAIKRYQKAIEICARVSTKRGITWDRTYWQSPDLPRHKQQFEQVVKVNPSDAAAYFNLGNLCLLTQQLDKGQQWVQQGLSKQPDSAFGHFLSGSLYARSGRTGEAEIALKRSLELDPIMSKAHLALVNLYLQQKRSEDAAVELRAFLKAFPEDSFAPRARQVLQKLEGSNTEPKPQ